MLVFRLRVVEFTSAGAVRVVRDPHQEPFVLPHSKGGIVWKGEVYPGKSLDVVVPHWLARKIWQLVGKTRAQVNRVREERRDAQAREASERYAEQERREREERERRRLYCSFCGKNDGEVFTLIAGPCNFICDECVGLCADIVAERRAGLARERLRRYPWFAEIECGWKSQVLRAK